MSIITAVEIITLVCVTEIIGKIKGKTASCCAKGTEGKTTLNGSTFSREDIF